MSSFITKGDNVTVKSVEEIIAIKYPGGTVSLPEGMYRRCGKTGIVSDIKYYDNDQYYAVVVEFADGEEYEFYDFELDFELTDTRHYELPDVEPENLEILMN